MEIPMYNDLTDKQKRLTKILAVVGAAAFVFLLVVSILISNALHSSQGTPPSSSGKSTLIASIAAQNLFTYANATALVPYALVKYQETNGTQLYADLDLYIAPPPTKIYVLNWTGECTKCSNDALIYSDLNSSLAKLGLVNATNPLTIVPPTSIQSIGNDSILIVMDGLMPSELLKSLATNYTVLDSLLQRSTSIIYVGQNFSKMISAQSTIQPAGKVPAYLSTTAASSAKSYPFVFNQSTFTFRNGISYGAISYIHTYTGSIVAFSNYPDAAWATPQQAALDLSSAAQSKFWLQKLAQGSATLNITNASQSGAIGVPMTTASLPNAAGVVSLLNNAYGVAHIFLLGKTSSSSSAPSALQARAVATVNFRPSYSLNGSIALPPSVIPGYEYNSTISMFSVNGQSASPRIDVFTKDMKYIYSLPPFFTKFVSPNYTFIEAFNFNLGPGQYIALLDGFSNQRYGGVFFTIPHVNVTAQNIDPQHGTVTFSVYVGKQPISNLNASMMLNNQYKSNATIDNGQLVFKMPNGQSLPTGNLTFTLNMLSSTYYYFTSYNPPAVIINKQYIEFIIAIIIVLLEVTLVRAPNRDEFYIDVPSMPEPPKNRIKVKSTSIIDVFKSLNDYYKWRYMPLSRTEFRYAVSMYIRSGSMQVVPTYNNIETMLNKLVLDGSLVSADGLYAPKLWVEQSKHDVEYLAVFKKLRVYLVSHGSDLSELDKSDVADIVTRLHNEKAYVIIYTKTSKFAKRIPVFKDGKTYLAFINSDKLDEFKSRIYGSTTREGEQLKLFISSGSVVLLDADNPEGSTAL